jgi:hypothetical protein
MGAATVIYPKFEIGELWYPHKDTYYPILFSRRISSKEEVCRELEDCEFIVREDEEICSEIIPVEKINETGWLHFGKATENHYLWRIEDAFLNEIIKKGFSEVYFYKVPVRWGK